MDSQGLLISDQSADFEFDDFDHEAFLMEDIAKAAEVSALFKEEHPVLQSIYQEVADIIQKEN